MIQKLSTGMYRVRYNYGHEVYYRKLKKIKVPNERVKAEISRLELTYQFPQTLKTRRSCNCVHEWQAREIEEIFKAAHDLEARGRTVPTSLLKFDIAPDRSVYIDDLGYMMASICGFHDELIGKMNFDAFIAQSDANRHWLKMMIITPGEVEQCAAKYCTNQSEITLKGKRYLFTGAVAGFTGCEDYIYSLRNLALELKVDGIIASGEWVKTIFLHKKAGEDTTILPALKALAKSVPLIAIRSSRDHLDGLGPLKHLGIKFVTGIEDEKNVFTGMRLQKGSSRDQLTRYEDAHEGKNIFTYCTYVGLKTQALKNGNIRYIIGSGSSGFNTPRARVWADAYDGQKFNSDANDSIGGHLLTFDKEGNVYPTTFRFHKQVRGIFFGGKVYKPNATKKGKLHLLLSDFHASAHKKSAFAGFIQFIRDHRDELSSCIINGDFFDNLVLCHHNRGKMMPQIKLAQRDMDFLKEVAYAKSCLALIVKELSPKTKLIFKMGNHEVNSFKSFLNRDINHFLESMLDLTRLLGLEDLGFKVVDSKVHYEVAEIVLHHGHEMMRRTARKTFGPNSVRGHSHGCEIGPDGMTLAGMEDPNKTDYLPHPYSKWSVGYAVMTELDGQSVLPQPYLVTNDRFADSGKIIELKKNIEIPLPKTIQFSYDLNWTGRELS